MHKTAHPAQWVIVALFGMWVAGCMIGAAMGDSSRDFHLREFGSLPVIDQGRIQPWDTYARSRLILINQKQTFADTDKRERPATQWVLDALTSEFKGGGAAFDYPMFRIESDQVRDLLHLEARPYYRYALKEFGAHLGDLKREADRAEKVEERNRSAYENNVYELARHVELFVRIANFESPGIVPTEGSWLSLRDVLADAQMGGQPHPVAMALFKAMQSYSKHDVDGFNDAIKEYRAYFKDHMPEALEKTGVEVYFNELAPFYVCAVAYVFIFVLSCVSWLGWFPTLNRGAFWSMVLIALVHGAALIARMYLQDRWLVFVTNLYSSAVFIGWGCVLVCLAIEYFYRNSIAIAVGGAAGAVSLLVAHMLSLESGDTLEKMQAVLDTTFWLATHVTCVTLGYTATFVAGGLGIVYIAAMATTALLARFAAGGNDNLRRFLESPESKLGARAFFARFFDTDASPTMSKMIYGVVCFGMFFSFFGTVLGGLWADYSWGRFWGWDPKENGALLIVIWCALILHARWGGMVKQRGVAILAVLGNIVTSWSWFGTNFLGIGLHSYGFMAGAMWWLFGFWMLILTIAAVGLLPLREWAKLAPPTPAPPPPKVPAAEATAVRV